VGSEMKTCMEHSGRRNTLILALFHAYCSKNARLILGKVIQMNQLDATMIY